MKNTKDDLQKVNKCENIGRGLLEKNLTKIFKNIKCVKFPPIEYSYDAIVIGDKNYMIEIKVRDLNSTDYKEFMIEEKKHKFLMDKIKEGFNPLYVNFFNDGVCLIWDMVKVGNDYEVRNYMINRLNVNPSYGKQDSKRYMLSANNAVKIKL